MSQGFGLVQVITGNGKGKTTTALGMALRAAGHGFKVCIIQLLKGGSYLGELKAMARLPEITIHQFGVDCQHPENIDSEGRLECNGCRACFLLKQEDRQKCREALDLAEKVLKDKACDLLILDEINVALDKGLVSVDEAMQLIRLKPESIELVFTGRNAPEALIDKADLVTVFRHLKHPFDNCLPSRKGIEY
ncbi:cob(I)yrinic acid a,c-diamide adenosyltransferase [archaeon]|nr:cob(I)yrinic acid a,c-diamide adenosyltransferase [archaeon]